MAVFTNGVSFDSSAISAYKLGGNLDDESKACYYMKEEEVNHHDCPGDKMYICQAIFPPASPNLFGQWNVLISISW